MLEVSNLNPFLSRSLKLIIALAVAALISAPFFLRKATTLEGQKISSLVNTHDMAQHLAVMEQFDLALRSGVVYPRWQPDFNGGYGLPWTNFYQPGFFYLTSLVNVVMRDWIYTLFVLSILSLAASGLMLYVLSRQFYSRSASAIAALFYMLMPYHSLEIYWRGAMPELQGFIFVPATLYFTYKLAATGKLRHYAGLGLSYGLSLMMHFPVAYLLTYTLAFYALIRAYRERDRRIALRVAGGMVVGFLVSAIYLVPALLESKYTREHFTGIFPYHNSYITLLPGGDKFTEVLNQSFAVQSLVLIIAVLILTKVPGAGSSESTSNAHSDDRFADRLAQTRLWIIMGVATTFMSTSYSIYISKLIPQIAVVSFAWRWLVITACLTALLLAGAIDRLQDRVKLSSRLKWLCRAALGAAIALSVVVTVQSVITRALSNPNLSRPANHTEEAFVPRTAKGPTELPDTPRVVIEPEGGASEVIRWDPYRREIQVNLKEPSRVRLKTYNFPGWVAHVDDKPAPMLSDNDGIQLVEVPAGIHVVQAEFTNTAPRIAGALLTAIGLLGVIGLAAVDRVRDARHVTKIAAEKNEARVSLKQFAVVVTTLLIGVVIIFWLSTRQPPGSLPPAAASRQPTGSVMQGSEATLHIEGVPSILVSMDEQTLKELMSALPAGDSSKINALIESGQLVRVENDTGVRILESGAGKTKVRILQGDHAMAEGWVSERWLR
jgi:hypothetical protein